MSLTVGTPGGSRVAWDCFVRPPDGSAVREAQVWWVSVGGGHWRVGWVPPVRQATVSFSVPSVPIGGSYTVKFSVPKGTPEQARVEFIQGTTKYTFNPARGTKELTQVVSAPATPGEVTWTVNVYTAGGDTTFTGTMSVIRRSTVSIAGLAWTMSADSGESGSTHPGVTFTVTLSDPGALSSVALSVALNGVWQATRQTWTNPTTSPLTYKMTFPSAGAWQVRVIATHKDGTTVQAVHAIEARRKELAISATPTSGTKGVNTTLRASATVGGSYLASTPGRWEYWENGKWNAWVSENPKVWAMDRTLKWHWREQFADGSVLLSNEVTTTVTAKTEVLRTGGNAATVQGALDEGRRERLPVRFTGTYQLETKVYIPEGARVTATGALFVSNHGSQMFTNKGANDVNAAVSGGYSRAGNIVWDGGCFNANNRSSTAFSFAHCPSVTVKNTTITNTGSAGHGIEINSSGGAANAKGVRAMVDADFKVQIIGNRFVGMGVKPRAADYDEAIHLDYSWIRYKADGSVDVAATSGVANDGTVCNNVLIRGNVVNKVPTACGGTTFPAPAYSYPVAFGLHHGADKTGSDAGKKRRAPVAQHKNIKIESNQFTSVWPVDPGNERGAITLRNTMAQVWVKDNVIASSGQALTMVRVNVDDVYPSANTRGFWITGNTFRSIGASTWNRRWVDTGVGTANDRWYDVFIDNNLFTGAVPPSQTTYLIGCGAVTGLAVTNNRFFGLTGTSALVKQAGNRIHGTPGAPAAGTTRMTLSGNRWSSNAAGTGAVTADS